MAETSHTLGIRPVKIPVPPRTTRERSFRTSQLKPIRGDTLTVVLGRSAVERPAKELFGLFSATLAKSSLRLLFGFLTMGISRRRPAVSLK